MSLVAALVRASLSAALICAASSTVLSQDETHPQLDRFSTGPPINTGSRGGIPSYAPRVPDILQSAVDGSDIRVNQVQTSAQNETSFAVNPFNENNWIGVANDYRSGNVETGWYSTLDGGQTWTTGTFGVDAGFSFSGDPCVCFDANGTAHVVCMMYFGPGGSKVAGYTSVDGGITWSAGQLIDLDGSNDKPQVAADLSHGPHRGDVTTAWDRFGAPGGDHIYVSTTNNSGATWSAGQRINGSSSIVTISPDVAYGMNSELFVMWADRGVYRIYVDRSFDGGASWGTDVQVASFNAVPSPIPGSSFRMFDIFALSADQTSGPYSGNVYVAYHHWATNNADIRVAVSSDSGTTWPVNLVVNDDGLGFDQVFPGVCVDAKGNAMISFYDRRLDPANYLLWTWVARSSDGGATWINHRASDTGWNHAATEFGGGFIGDYCDVECSAHGVYPFWCDGRSGGTQDVYTDVMNLDFHTDVDTISAGTGGAAALNINIGPNYNGFTYMVFTSGSGTSPGVTAPSGVHVSLNPDIWTTWIQLYVNSAIFPNTLGILDATGSATAGINTLGPRPFLNGLNLDFVVVVFDPLGNVVFATSPTRVSFTP